MTPFEYVLIAAAIGITLTLLGIPIGFILGNMLRQSSESLITVEMGEELKKVQDGDIVTYPRTERERKVWLGWFGTDVLDRETNLWYEYEEALRKGLIEE